MSFIEVDVEIRALCADFWLRPAGRHRVHGGGSGIAAAAAAVAGLGRGSPEQEQLPPRDPEEASGLHDLHLVSCLRREFGEIVENPSRRMMLGMGSVVDVPDHGSCHSVRGVEARILQRAAPGLRSGSLEVHCSGDPSTQARAVDSTPYILAVATGPD